jgi:translation initiation factor 2 beta subunit (eIF-2beta)/eIF-5
MSSERSRANNNHKDNRFEYGDLFTVRCGRCGRPLLVKLREIADVLTIECERCAAQPPFCSRSVYIVFE